MASQEEKVAKPEEIEGKDDTAEFSGAWDAFEAEEAGQSAPAAERQDDPAKKPTGGGDEAGQGVAEAGQPNAGTTPGADADQASRGELSDDVLANAAPEVRALIEHEREERRKAQNLARSNGSRLAQALNELAAAKRHTTS
jgi:hypothetical protein